MIFITSPLSLSFRCLISSSLSSVFCCAVAASAAALLPLGCCWLLLLLLLLVAALLLKRRRTSEGLAEIETAVTETPRQTLSVLRRNYSLNMSRCGAPYTKIPSAVLQARPCTEIDG